MGEAKAVFTLIVGPEYRPSDPYPSFAPDDPEWDFSEYDDYYYWLSQKVCRVIVHDPKTGESVVRRASRTPVYTHNSHSSRNPISDAFWPMGSGLLYMVWEGGNYTVGYARYAVGDEPEPPIEVLVTEAQAMPDADFQMFAETDGRQLALFTVRSIYGGVGSAMQLITPEPLPGETVLVDTILPNVYSGTYGSLNAYYAAELSNGALNVRANYQEF